MLNKVYHNADEKFLKCVVLHAHSDNKLYADAKHKVAVGKAEFATIALDRLLIEKDGVHYAPNSVKEGVDYEVVILTTSGSVTAVTLKTSGK